MIWAWIIAAAGVTALGIALALIGPVFRYLERNRWAIDKGEMR